MDRPLVLESSILKVPVRRADTVERKMSPTKLTWELFGKEIFDLVVTRVVAKQSDAEQSRAAQSEPERREADESPRENPRKRD